jgi:hypothetical protein
VEVAMGKMSIVAMVALALAGGCKMDDAAAPRLPRPSPQAATERRRDESAPLQAQVGAPMLGELAKPADEALVCRDDAKCAGHRCNARYGKCAWPCQTDADCVEGARCRVGLGAVAVCVASE